jgi:alpha-beta hydrolase superfamily lysophospholipase
MLSWSTQEASEESKSLMDALHEKGLQPYALDFRGFGGSPPDAKKFAEPYKCVADVEGILKWIMDRRHGIDRHDKRMRQLCWAGHRELLLLS